MKIYNLVQIETPRLIIRPVQLGDELALNKAINNSLNLLQKWQAWAKDPSLEATRGFIERGVFAWGSCTIEDFPMVAIHKQDQKIIGASGYNDRSNIHKGVYEIGYWCDIDYQGKGYVTEYANALTRYAFESLKATKVMILMQTENTKSIAVAERLKFNKEGTQDRDLIDCVSGKPEQNYLYSKTDMDDLPPLEVSWIQAKSNSEEAKIIAWAKEILNITDEKAFASSRTILKTPWSSVMAIETGKERVYLKHTPELIALEAQIIELLHKKFHAHVPNLIANNAELNCFLMNDSGIKVREILKKQFDTELFCEVINQFVLLQLDISQNIEVFLSIGVPDWQINKLPDLFKYIASQKELLVAHGLTEKEISELAKIYPKIVRACEKLDDYGIKPTLVQPDFNDNNNLINEKTQEITLIDLGEIVISHPFFSLLNGLQQMKKHHRLTEDDERYLKIKDTCLKHFIRINPKQDVLDAFELAETVWPIYGVLAHYRLIEACGIEQIMSFENGRFDRLGNSFREVLLALKKISI